MAYTKGEQETGKPVRGKRKKRKKEKKKKRKKEKKANLSEANSTCKGMKYGRSQID